MLSRGASYLKDISENGVVKTCIRKVLSIVVCYDGLLFVRRNVIVVVVLALASVKVKSPVSFEGLVRLSHVLLLADGAPGVIVLKKKIVSTLAR
jgi:hypothetical protein